MIFVTVGAQMAFPRLVNAIDCWARDVDRRDVFAQIGPAKDHPTFIEWTRYLPPVRFREMIMKSDLVIGHAGMGTIIGALVARKPLVVMPRRGDLQETRNDHQMATAKRFAADRNITVANDVEQLIDTLSRADEILAPSDARSHAADRLITAIRDFTYGSETAEVVIHPFTFDSSVKRPSMRSVTIND